MSNTRVDAASMARLLKWLRREVNRDLREWRGHLKAGTGAPLAGRLPDLVADCKAKLAMIAWAEHWHAGWLSPDYALVDRERRMVDLKREVDDLLETLGRGPKYEAPQKVAELRASTPASAAQ